MKKTYINPEITVVTMKYQPALLAGSNNDPVHDITMPGGEGITWDLDGMEDGEYDM